MKLLAPMKLLKWQIVNKLTEINWINCTFSLLFVLVVHFTVDLVPLFFAASPIFIQLILSALVVLAVIGFGRWSRRIIGVHASAPAFVFFNILFIWIFYMVVIRKAMSCVIDIIFGGEVLFLSAGFFSMISSDPGFVVCDSCSLSKFVENSASKMDTYDQELDDSISNLPHEGAIGVCAFGSRIRYCKTCRAYIQGFDHHCPAFGNCIGKNNHPRFVLLLVGIIITEASYTACSFQFVTKFRIYEKIILQSDFIGALSISTMLFSSLQIVWQVVFLTWHMYCVCANIKTYEWINWKKCPEFHFHVQNQTGNNCTIRFRNPYDEGILQNVRHFFSIKR